MPFHAAQYEYSAGCRRYAAGRDCKLLAAHKQCNSNQVGWFSAGRFSSNHRTIAATGVLFRFCEGWEFCWLLPTVVDLVASLEV